IAAVLRRVDIDPGVHPALDEELTAKIEILVLLGGAEPRREAAGVVHDDVALVDVEGGFEAFFDLPAVQRPPIEERDEAGLDLRLEERWDGGRGQKLA